LGSGDRTDAIEATQGGATGIDVTESPADGTLDDIAWRASDMAVGEHGLHRVRAGVYHRAFMEGEEGTEAMVEAYSGESLTISRQVLLSVCARWLQGKVLITCYE
jgi:hypothetical protein